MDMGQTFPSRANFERVRGNMRDTGYRIPEGDGLPPSVPCMYAAKKSPVVTVCSSVPKPTQVEW